MSSNEIYEYFQKHANESDDVARTAEPHLQEIGNYLHSKFALGRDTKILDIACYKGFSSLYLQRNFVPAAETFGVDIINHRLQSVRVDQFHQMDINSESISQYFSGIDFAFCLRTAMFFETKKWIKALKNIKGSLKENADFFCQDFVMNETLSNNGAYQDSNTSSGLTLHVRKQKDIENAFNAAGFQIESAEIPTPKHDQLYTEALFHLRKTA